jgi:hypothetical protein
MSNKYWPRQFEEMIEDNSTSLLNEPILDAIPLRLVHGARPLHAILVASLNHT